MALGAPQNPTITHSADTGRSYGGPLAMVTTLFFMWGFLTCLNDILVPHLKSIFDLNYAEVILVQFCFFSAYAVFSVPSGKIIERIGYQKMMVIGLLTMGLGALMFIPAAAVPSFPLFLAALIILAAGITALQVAANPYVAVLGPARTASSRLNLTQAFNSLGTTVAPFFGGLLILGAALPKTPNELAALSPPALHAYRIEQASSVKLPYLFIAAALVVLAVVIGKFNLPHIPEAEGGHAVANDSVWRHRNLVMGTGAIFCYVGAEVAIGSFLVNYMNLPNIGNLQAEVAAKYLTFYWGGAMIGRFIGSAVLQKIGTPPGASVSTRWLPRCWSAPSMLSSGHVAMWVMLLVGLFNSIMFPSIFTLGIEGLGPLTGEASGLLVMAIVGGAIIPELQGLLADRIGLHHAFVLPVICYLYILFFAVKGQPSKQLAT